MSVRTLPEIGYYAPATIAETLNLLEQHGNNAVIMAGGTDVVPKMKGGVLSPKYIVSIANVEELKYIKYDEENGLTFGAGVSLIDLEKNQLVKELYPALYVGCHSIASTQIRNAATVVGNICNAVPSADTAPGLLVLDARIKICSKRGVRIVPIDEFFVGVCKTVLEPDELVTEIQIPAKKENEDSIYFSFTARKALDLAVVGVAVKLTVDDEICQDAKIALGAVAITPKRAKDGENRLIGKKITEELAQVVGAYVSEHECSPISDLRASKEYRKEIVSVLVKDGILVASGLKERECVL